MTMVMIRDGATATKPVGSRGAVGFDTAGGSAIGRR